jgi:[protein-PII] uridylyltransferase
MSLKQSESATKIVAKPLSSLEDVRSEFLSTGNAAAVLTSRTTFVDDLVTQACRSWLIPVFPRGLSVLAVGGYGRRELFPQSDVDILLLVDKEISSDAQREAVAGFLRTLWDSGLRLSQSVHTPGECCTLDSKNVELSISLLDRRFLIGDSGLFEAAGVRLQKFFRSNREALIRHLCQMTEQRHTKYHNTIYHLEPNIKETPGGVRDLHLIGWLRALRQAEVKDSMDLTEARDFLSVLRCHLHYRTGRDSNVLTFDFQEALASDPAAWMRTYYRHARDVYRTARREMDIGESLAEGGLIRSFRDWRSRLSNADFTVSRDRVFFRSPQQLAAEPDLALRAFEFVARHGVRLSLDAERRLIEFSAYLRQYFAARKPVWPALKRILSQPHAALALRSMHETGLLHLIFPAWLEIECLVVRDFYHRYTVDEHTLVTIEYLEELRATTDPSRRRFRELLAETENVPLLYVALLFHDTGKSGGMEGHASASAKMAGHVLAQLEMPESDRRRVLFLIEHHLDLSAVMNSRDLSDPAVAVQLAHRIGTMENLKYLTLLTYADISAVNPEAMSPWRIEQLWRTYLVTHRELTRELDSERIKASGSGAEGSFLEGFPTRYIRTHTEAEIAAHQELALQSRDKGVAVDLRRDSGGWVLTVVTGDHPNLFASLAGALAAFAMDIVKAEAFSNKQGLVLDTFVFEDPKRTLELNPGEGERLKTTVMRAALGKEDVRRLLRGRERAAGAGSKRIPATVSFDNSASESATLVEIVAQDRPGLLYDLADTFSANGCSIEVVLIDTEAHKAIDVFYVTAGGGKLPAEAQQSLRTKLLDICNG